MQQSLTCPSCGSPISESQQFCGICGTQLTQTVPQAEMVQPVETAPEPTVTIPVSESRSTVIEDISQTAPDVHYATATAPASEIVQPNARNRAAAGRPRRSGLLRVSGVIFQVIGWIVLVVGSILSIAMGVLAIMGVQFVSLIPGMGNLIGNTAITVAAVGLILSLLYGFGLLAFSEMCFTLIDINKAIRSPK